MKLSDAEVKAIRFLIETGFLRFKSGDFPPVGAPDDIEVVPRDELEKLAEYNVPVTRDLEDAEIKRTSVWELKA